MTVDTLGRAFDLYRRTATSRSAIALVLANLIPLVGVLFFGWSLLTILVLFWIENGIVGFWNVPRILMARQSLIESVPDMLRDAGFDERKDPEAAAKLEARLRDVERPVVRFESSQGRAIDPRTLILSRFAGLGGLVLAVFFLIHYGIFWLVHGIFVFALPTFVGATRSACLDGLAGACASPFGELVWTNVAIAGVALLLSHGASFLFNYVGRREYLATSPIRQMSAPYGRVVVLHLTIIFGAIFAAFLGAPIAALVVLVVLKGALDLRLHLREQRALGPVPVGVPGPATRTLSPVEPGHPE